MSSAVCCACHVKFDGNGQRCPTCKAKRNTAVNQAKVHYPFYDTAAWRRFSKWYKAYHPLCEVCLSTGKVTPVYCVDHIIELRDGGAKIDSNNAMSLCRKHHGAKTAKEAKKRDFDCVTKK